MLKDTSTTWDLNSDHRACYTPGEMEKPSMDGTAALTVLTHARSDQVVVLSESTRQDWPPLSIRTALDFPMAGSTSKASSVASGIALARHRRLGAPRPHPRASSWPALSRGPALPRHPVCTARCLF